MGAVDWANLSVGVAAVVALVYTVRAQRSVISQFLAALTNDVAHVEEALREVAVAMERVADGQERILREVRPRAKPRGRSA